jgi:hypothetical protein
MQIEYTNTAEDFQSLARYTARWWDHTFAPACFVLGVLPPAVLSAWGGHTLWAAAGLALGLAAALLRYWSDRRLASQFSDGVRATLKLTPVWLDFRTHFGETRIRWPAIRESVEHDGRLLVRWNRLYFIIPRAAFASPGEYEAFRGELNERIREANATPADLSGQAPPPGPLPASEVECEVCYRNEWYDITWGVARATGTKVLRPVRFFLATFVMGTIGLLFQTLTTGIGIGLGQAATTYVGYQWTLLIAYRIQWYVLGLSDVVTVPRRLQLSNLHLAMSEPLEEQILPWERIEAIDHDDRYNYIFSTRVPFTGFVVPRSAFASDVDFEWFYYFAAERHAKAQEGKKAAAPSEPEPQTSSGPLPAVPVETGNPYQAPRSDAPNL